MFLSRLILLLAHVTVVIYGEKGVAVIEQLSEEDTEFQIKFEYSEVNDRVQVYSSFDLPGHLTTTWQIHHLPVKMGSDTCSERELGGCFQCNEVINPKSNNPTETREVCIKSGRDGGLSANRRDLPECATIKGKDGIVGRSIVVKVEDNSATKPEKVYCATIYDQNDLYPRFMSTVAWFDSPLTGYVAFRKEDSSVSYIIVNLTRTVDNRGKPDENFKWEIRGSKNIRSRDALYNPNNALTEDIKYNENCDPSSDTGHQSCAAGDLWKKHGRLELRNSLHTINLMMYVDNNLASESLSEGQSLVILDTTTLPNGTTEQIVASSRIESLQPISVNIPFMDGSKLKLLQRDDWSPIKQWYEYAHQNTPGKWEVSVYNLPPLQIFGGDQFNCDEILTRGWSPSSSEILPSFKTSREERYLNQSYTLYGRNSMMYRGVAIKPENDAKYKCASITYKQDEEKISYSLLNPTDHGMMDQRVIILIIEHTVVRQTTVMMATLCGSVRFLLKLTESPECGDTPRDTYNPFGVCPAYCPLGGPCKQMCPPEGDLYSNCCTMCVYDSSFLCPVGDLHRRLDEFQPSNRAHYTNRETVFSVKNEVNLPLSHMNDKFIGVHVFSTDPSHRVLMRCGVVKELTETVVTLDTVDGIKEGRVTLSQRTAWQPITLSSEGIQVESLTIWNNAKSSSKLCTGKTKEADDKPFYQEDFRKDLKYEDSFVPRRVTLENKDKIPTFFGKESIIQKSLELVYKTRDGRSETTHVNIRPDWAQNETEKLQAVLVDNQDQRVLQFNFEQREGHLAADTYVKVEVMSRRYCGKRIKWYLVSRQSVRNFKQGDHFAVPEYGDERMLKSRKHELQSCSRTPAQYPYNLNMGDLSGILGDVVLDGPGRVYVHESLPLLEVQGHYLLIADVNNTIIATIQLKTPEEKQTISLPENKNQSSNSTVIIIACVVLATLIMVVGAVLLYHCLIRRQTAKDQNYHTLSQDPHNRPHQNGQQLKLVRNKVTNTLCYMHIDVQLHKVKTQDVKTGVVSYVHPSDLERVQIDDQNFVRYVESNGSTNGSSLTRSRGTVAEENLYTTVSPTAGHPNNMGSLIASPESSSSSLSSHT